LGVRRSRSVIVLARKPAVPELIRTEHFVFVIEPDGEARYVGKTEDVLKK
jgi:hypothetical protein